MDQKLPKCLIFKIISILFWDYELLEHVFIKLEPWSHGLWNKGWSWEHLQNKSSCNFYFVGQMLKTLVNHGFRRLIITKILIKKKRCIVFCHSMLATTKEKKKDEFLHRKWSLFIFRVSLWPKTNGMATHMSRCRTWSRVQR